MRLTKIIATVGPASSSKSILTELIKSGVDVFRFNLSHGDRQQHHQNLQNIRQISAQLDKEVGVLFDLSGPKFRVGQMAEEVQLKQGQQFTLTSRKIIGNDKEVSINQPRLIKDLAVKDHIFLNEGQIELVIKAKNEKNLICSVRQGGMLSSHKGINVSVPVSIKPLTPKDYKDIDFAVEEGVDWLALSFVKERSDVAKLKKILRQKNSSIQVMAKIEKREAVDNIDSIIEEADGIMVARGDLGLEVPIEEVPIIQKQVITKCQQSGKAVVTATQMLESMITNLRPTRAEVNDVANAIFDQTDAVMLSAETAAGKYPVEAFKTMAKVAQRTESAIDYGKLLSEKSGWVSNDITNAISYGSCELVNDLSAAVLVTSTQSGATAKRAASYRCPSPILAVTPRVDVVNKLKLIWGVVPVLIEASTDINDMLTKAKQAAIKSRLARKGDKIVITAGALVNLPGTTNLIKVDKI